MSKILVTAANGQLGLQAVKALLKRVSVDRVVASVRRLESAEPLKSLGVEVRQLDYSRAETVLPALSGIGRLLLISSSEVGQRAQQHANVIEAAQSANLEQIVYTSLLCADTSPLALALEHRETEAAFAASGLPYTIMRNGWYTENFTGGLSAVLEQGALIGASGDGRVSAATRADYAEAAAVVLTSHSIDSGRVYELAGDQAFSKAELAAEISAQSGRTVVYQDLGQDGYRAALVSAGVPEAFAGILADSDIGAASGALFEDSGILRQLLGRPTTPWKETVSLSLRQLGFDVANAP